jgi:hypothetical protein
MGIPTSLLTGTREYPGLVLSPTPIPFSVPSLAQNVRWRGCLTAPGPVPLPRSLCETQGRFITPLPSPSCLSLARNVRWRAVSSPPVPSLAFLSILVPVHSFSSVSIHSCSFFFFIFFHILFYQTADNSSSSRCTVQ